MVRSSSYRYWLVCHPDISRPIGGIKQIHRLCEAINICGRNSTIIQSDSNFHPRWFSSTVETISADKWKLIRDKAGFTDKDILIFPETYLASIDDYARGISSIVFNQNGSYTFGLPGSKSYLSPAKTLELYQQSCIKHVFCVSKHDYDFLSNYICMSSSSVSLLVNGLEDFPEFSFDSKVRRIIYMPRKNAFDASIVSSLLRSRPLLTGWDIVPIVGRSHAEVISLLQESLLFLSFGHPEGFGLPVAEAMASGCAVVGYSGLGGRELFEIGRKYSMAEEIAYGDWASFVESIEDFHKSYESQSSRVLDQLKSMSVSLKSIYSFSHMCNSVSSALDSFEDSLS